MTIMSSVVPRSMNVHDVAGSTTMHVYFDYDHADKFPSPAVMRERGQG